MGVAHLALRLIRVFLAFLGFAVVASLLFRVLVPNRPFTTQREVVAVLLHPRVEGRNKNGLCCVKNALVLNAAFHDGLKGFGAVLADSAVEREGAPTAGIAYVLLPAFFSS